jgi:energy-coupling factor transport system substrate-specific component
VSWELSAYGLLAAVLVAGLAWYERSRPPARIVALVAALAALAVAGRLALAAVPNVVATTDIVLITGYAVGAAPGFAVGALAAAVSNLWLGQGPWTPWQMAGWGLVGLAGAALALVTGRRLGRVGLATACGLAGLAYGALLDLSVMVTYGGEQSLDRYLAISSRGIPFNVAHAAGNVVLALAAGPALVRMISRYRSRFEFTWHESAATSASLLLALVLVLPPSTALAGGGTPAARWLERAQSSKGGFGAEPHGSPSPAMTGWAMLGLEASGRNPLDVRRAGHSPTDYLRASAGLLRTTGDLERTALALEGAGVSPRSFAGRNLMAELRRRRSPSGSFEGQVNLTAFGILALRGAAAPPSSLKRSSAWLRRAQNGDGGWGFRRGAASDPDSTGAALQGLAAGGGKGGAIAGGSSYLRRAQRPDGGFALAGSRSSNTQSTAWAVQGLVAAGVRPAGVRARRHSPLDYLAKRQAADGHFRYSSSSDQTPVWVTGQALLAVEGAAFPLAAVPRSPSPPGRQTRASPSRAGAGHGAGAGESKVGSSPHALVRSAKAGVAHRRPAVRSGAAAVPSSRGRSAGLRPRLARDPVPSSDASGRGGGRSAASYVAGGSCLLAAALAAGFGWYRRRVG